ncbi:carbohydrate sulfotransferase 14-like [Mya arenaria]|uniref:carbohydrate sulfotransferase 14-like n=1 Tax=Mya arenaria TaxID=6604 RepID=UPI0022E1B64C|nr:carbohydrate sulfotransferase 14-like [Mya arenaria]
MLRKLRRHRQNILIVGLAIINVVLFCSNFMQAGKTTYRQSIDKLIPPDKNDGHHRTTGSDGYNLAIRVHKRCFQSGFEYKNRNVNLMNIYETKSKTFEYCPIWKVGTTYLKRLFMIKNLNKYANLTNPYNISFLERYDSERGMISNEDDVKRFMFVRNPYQRLLSSYVDKLLAPNPVYWKIIGIPAIKSSRKEPTEHSVKCGHDLTFKEFIHHITMVLPTGKHTVYGHNKRKVGVLRDLHFELYNVICRPCHVKYNFIGKMESFDQDSLEFIKEIELPKVADFLTKNGKALAVDDAIKDTTYQPFNIEFLEEYLKCITRHDAMKRAWKKLQLRGLIGNTPLQVTDEDARTMTHEQFLQLAVNARRASSSEERKTLKRRLYLEMYSTVDRGDLELISTLYKDDFNIFEYDSRPKDIFTN